VLERSPSRLADKRRLLVSASQLTTLRCCCRRQRKLENLTVITADMVTFEPPLLYDRVVSVEMFEHMKNYQVLREIT
jgi:cyclopropane fatty-acyl-phospholipid synthase-like methyltransferase